MQVELLSVWGLIVHRPGTKHVVLDQEGRAKQPHIVSISMQHNLIYLSFVQEQFLLEAAFRL